MSFEQIIATLSDDTTLTKGLILDLLRNIALNQQPQASNHGHAPALPTSWRERIWICPDETQLSVTEFAEAANRKRS